MNVKTTITIAALSGVLLACGADNKNGEPQGAIPAGPLSALEKAKGTEKMLQDAADKKKQEMEKQGM